MAQIVNINGELVWDGLQVSQLAEEYIDILERKSLKPYDLLEFYKGAIGDNDFIKAAAINLALQGSSYRVLDTHMHIPTIHQNFWKDLGKMRERDGFVGTYLEMPHIKKYSWSVEQAKVLYIY